MLLLDGEARLDSAPEAVTLLASARGGALGVGEGDDTEREVGDVPTQHVCCVDVHCVVQCSRQIAAQQPDLLQPNSVQMNERDNTTHLQQVIGMQQHEMG